MCVQGEISYLCGVCGDTVFSQNVTYKCDTARNTKSKEIGSCGTIKEPEPNRTSKKCYPCKIKLYMQG